MKKWFVVCGLVMSGLTAIATAQDRSLADAPGAIEGNRNGHGRLKFGPCSENSNLECGTLAVPVDYKRPHGEKVGIAVIRAKATNPARRIGVLVGNPGGPGLSGVNFILAGINSPLFAPLLERFDIVSFDPRGVARSRGVACDVVVPPVPADLDDDAAMIAFYDEFSRRYSKACLDQNGAFVRHIGTNNVARDMDAIREALGEKQITYASGSYGTELGAVYASLFPERVRGALLDGGVGPDFKDYLVEDWSLYSGAHEVALQYLDQSCRRDSNCQLAEKGVVATYDEVAERLRRAPVTSPSGVVLTVDAFRFLLSALLDVELASPLTVSLLAQSQAGDFGLAFALLGPGVPATSGSLFPITCNDYGTRRGAAEYLPVDEAVGARNPRFFGRFFVADLTSLCASWPPSETPVIRNVKGKTANPLLLVGVQFDSKTPLAGLRSLARTLGMENSLVSYLGGGHTAFANGSACIKSTILDYLIDLRLPPPGFSCPAEPMDFSPSSSLMSQRRIEMPRSVWRRAVR
jgi:pimeloyl-ACP methyl ester carboxylesterase